MNVAVVSPHADDAVFSCAERMLSRPGDFFTIICPIMGIPAEDPGRKKYIILTEEHRMVCDVAGWDFINGPFFDDAVEQEQPEFSMAAWLTNIWDFKEVWIPRGIHHPDHLWVARSIPPTDSAKVLIYEELPYWRRYPGPPPLGRFIAYNRTNEIVHKKMELCRLYESQMQSPDLEKDLYMPERLWLQ